jgi:tRNA uridine 5-carboxymethylaminomethyl modification enzyme
LRATLVRPALVSAADAQRVLHGPLNRDSHADELLRRPEVTYQTLMTLAGVGPGVGDVKVAEQVETQIKYAGYIERQQEEIARSQRHESLALPADIDYAQVRGLSTEVCEKLTRIRPATLGQAGRIAGVTPAAISLLLVHLRRGSLRRTA